MIDLSHLKRVAGAATHHGAMFVERRDCTGGGIDYIVHGEKDFAWCRDDLDRKAKFNAAYIAAFNPSVAKQLIEALECAVGALEWYANGYTDNCLRAKQAHARISALIGKGEGNDEKEKVT